MSSATNSVPPAEPVTRIPPVRGGGWSWWKSLLTAGIVGVAGYLAYLYFQPYASETETSAAALIRTAKVTSGPIEQVARVSGTTSSIVFSNVRAPRQRGPERRSLILLEMLPSGARVKKGDVVARIDGQSLKDHIDDVNSIVLAAEADVKKRRAEQTVDWNNLEQNLRVAKSEIDKWKLEARAAEVRTVIDRELLKLGEEESEAAYQQQQKDLALEKNVEEAELKILELTTERHKRHRDRHAYDLKRYTVHSPMNGMVVRQQIFRNGEFGMAEVGDRLWPGFLFLKIMDTDHMEVEGNINQAESSRFKIGMEARVGLDAFPDLTFKGKVSSIGALAKSSSQSQYVRQVPVTIKIEGSHPKLIPDLSAYADVILDRVDQAVKIPRATVFEEDGQPYVFVKRGDRFEKRPVELGFRNYTEVAVTSGLAAGEVVAVDRPVS